MAPSNVHVPQRAAQSAWGLRCVGLAALVAILATPLTQATAAPRETEIELSDGRTMKGRVDNLKYDNGKDELSTGFTIIVSGATIDLRWDQVTPKSRYTVRRQFMGSNSAADVFALGVFCLDAGLRVEAEREFAALSTSPRPSGRSAAAAPAPPSRC
jgi:hypothetical protein